MLLLLCIKARRRLLSLYAGISRVRRFFQKEQREKEDQQPPEDAYNAEKLAEPVDVEDPAKDDRHDQQPENKPEKTKNHTVSPGVDSSCLLFELRKLRQIAPVTEHF